MKSNSEGTENGLVRVRSPHSAEETVARLARILEARGVKLFATVDHSGEAERTGLQMPNTKLLIFVSPKAGTPLMIAAPSIAIDLPLKILVTEDSEARVWMMYNEPSYLRDRHGLAPSLEKVLGAVIAIAKELTGAEQP